MARLVPDKVEVAPASPALGLEIEGQVILLYPPLVLPLDSVSTSFSAT